MKDLLKEALWLLSESEGVPTSSCYGAGFYWQISSNWFMKLSSDLKKSFSGKVLLRLVAVSRLLRYTFAFFAKLKLTLYRSLISSRNCSLYASLWRAVISLAICSISFWRRFTVSTMRTEAVGDFPWAVKSRTRSFSRLGSGD